MRRFFCVSFKDIVQTSVKINDLVVQNPFIGIVDNIRFYRDFFNGIFIQHDVLPDKIAHFGITPVSQKLTAGKGMILPGVKTSGFGDIVQQSGRSDQIKVEMILAAVELIGKKSRDPAHLHGMVHNVLHHLHFAHHLVALRFGWDQECHRSIEPPELMKRYHAV